MKTKYKIVAILASILLLLSTVFTFVACGSKKPKEHISFEKGKYWGIDETSMRNPNSPFTTIKVGSTPSTSRDVIVYKDSLTDNPYFNMWTDVGYKVKSIGNIQTDGMVLSALKYKLEGFLGVQYLCLGSSAYFYNFDIDGSILSAALLPNSMRPNAVQSFNTDPILSTAQPMGGLERRIACINENDIVSIDYEKGTAQLSMVCYQPEMPGSPLGTGMDIFTATVMINSTLYDALMADLKAVDLDLHFATYKELNAMPKLKYGVVKYNYQWYIVHRV